MTEETRTGAIARETKRGYDHLEVKRRTCQSCGMLLDHAGEFHPLRYWIAFKVENENEREYMLRQLDELMEARRVES